MTFPVFPTLDQALVHWTRQRPDALALADETRRWTFAELHAAVSARVRQLHADCAPLMSWVQGADVADSLIDFLAIVTSGRTAAVADPDWPDSVRTQVQAQVGQQPAVEVPPPGPLTPFYVGFTSGSTGLPKGFRRHHRSWTESLRVALDTFGAGAAGRVLAPGRISHSLFLFGMLQGLWSGAGVRVQQRFSAARTLTQLAAGEATCLVAVPSQLLLMLEIAKRRQLPPIAVTEQILISGARWMRESTPALRALFPQARIVEFYGASETSFMAWTDADEHLPVSVVGRPFANVEVQIRDAAPDGDGLIFVRSPMLFMDYVGRGTNDGADATAALREPAADGHGDWLSVRDMGRLDEQGRLCLAGRQQRMIVTQGKNLFPEEVESVLQAHPAIAAASVQGQDDGLRGKVVVVCIQLANDGVGGQASADLSADLVADLAVWCRARLEAYKVPRRFHVCADWPLTASGKTDHRRLAEWLVTTTEESGV